MCSFPNNKIHPGNHILTWSFFTQSAPRVKGLYQSAPLVFSAESRPANDKSICDTLLSSAVHTYKYDILFRGKTTGSATSENALGAQSHATVLHHGGRESLRNNSYRYKTSTI